MVHAPIAEVHVPSIVVVTPQGSRPIVISRERRKAGLLIDVWRIDRLGSAADTGIVLIAAGNITVAAQQPDHHQLSLRRQPPIRITLLGEIVAIRNGIGPRLLAGIALLNPELTRHTVIRTCLIPGLGLGNPAGEQRSLIDTAVFIP